MIEIRDATVQDIAKLARVLVKADWDTYAALFGAEAYMLDVADSERRWRHALRSADECDTWQRIVGFGHCYEDRIGALLPCPGDCLLHCTWHAPGWPVRK